MIFNKLVDDRRGIFYSAVIIVIVLFITDICYLAIALTNNMFFDAWVSGGYIVNVQQENLLATLRFIGPIVIVILNLGLIALLIVSAWKRGTNETEDLPL